MRLNQWLVNQMSRPSTLTGWLLAGIWNRRNRALNDTALAALDLAPDDRLLEVGFGGGYLLDKAKSALPRGFAAGIDASPALVGLARRRFYASIQAGRLEIQCAPAEAIPYPEMRFNSAVSVNSIFYWKDVPKAFNELNRVLEENGRLVLVFTDKRCLEQRSITRPGRTALDEWETRYLLQRAGFHVTAIARSRDAHRDYLCILAFKRPDRQSKTTGQPLNR